MYDIKEIFTSFTNELYEDDNLGDSLPMKKHFNTFVKDFLETLPEVELKHKSGGRVATNPGDPYNKDLCRCRVWNKGLAKQCSSKKINGQYCTMHFKKTNEYGGWSYGFYDEEKPTEQLFNGAGKTKKGDKIKWKSSTKLTKEIIELKKEYESKLGKKSSGPKANDPEWLRKKIIELESSDSDSDSELISLKRKFENIFKKKPKGPKCNDANWLKAKIHKEEAKKLESDKDESINNDSNNDDCESEHLSNTESDKDKSNTESDNDESDKQSEKSEITNLEIKKNLALEDDNQDDVTPTTPNQKPPWWDGEDPRHKKDPNVKELDLDLSEDDKTDEFIKFKFQGVTYSKCYHEDTCIYSVWNEDGDEVGIWIDKIPSDNDDGYIQWKDDIFEDIHKDDENYNEN